MKYIHWHRNPAATNRRKEINHNGKDTIKTFTLATAHPAENVDNVAFLESFMEVSRNRHFQLLTQCSREQKSDYVKTTCYLKWKNKERIDFPPLKYLEFLVLMKNCRLIITDSVGAQEGATAPSIKKRVLVIRLSTDKTGSRWIGFAKIVGTDKKSNLAAMHEAVKKEQKLPFTSPFRDGTAAVKNIDVIKKECA